MTPNFFHAATLKKIWTEATLKQIISGAPYKMVPKALSFTLDFIYFAEPNLWYVSDIIYHFTSGAKSCKQMDCRTIYRVSFGLLTFVTKLTFYMQT